MDARPNSPEIDPKISHRLWLANITSKANKNQPQCPKFQILKWLLEGLVALAAINNNFHHPDKQGKM